MGRNGEKLRREEEGGREGGEGSKRICGRKMRKVMGLIACHLT